MTMANEANLILSGARIFLFMALTTKLMADCLRSKFKGGIAVSNPEGLKPLNPSTMAKKISCESSRVKEIQSDRMKLDIFSGFPYSPK